MKRASIVLAIVSGLGLAHPEAQGRPNFSGTWTLQSSVPANTWAMGLRFIASQDSSTLLIERPEATQRILFEGRSDGTQVVTAVNTPDTWRELYRLDGSELKRTFEVAPPRPDAIMFGGTLESVSTAAWENQQLVIVTKNIMVTTERATGKVTRNLQTIRNALHFEPDGALVIDHLITVDPVPGAGANATTSRGLIHSVYRKG